MLRSLSLLDQHEACQTKVAGLSLMSRNQACRICRSAGFARSFLPIWRRQVAARYRREVGPKIALVLGKKSFAQEKEPLQADSVIASSVNMIAAKTAIPTPVSGSGESFGQILQGMRDETAAPLPGAPPNSDPPTAEPAAASDAVPLPGQTAASDRSILTAAPGEPVTTSNPRASDGTGARALKPARGLPDERRATSSPAGPPAETVIPAAALIAAPVAPIPAALPARDPTLATGSQPPASTSPVDAPSATAATPKTAPYFAGLDPQAPEAQDSSNAPPGSNPGASADTPLLPASALQAVTAQALPPYGSAAAPSGTGPVRPSRETQRLRPADATPETHQAHSTSARTGQQNTLPAFSLSQATERAEARPRESNLDNTIAFRRVETASEPAPSPPPWSSPSIEQVVPVEISSTPPDPVSVAPIPQAGVGHPAASQVGSALLTLAKSTDGSEAMIIRLQPEELGRVQIRIARALSGATQVEITAEKSATLLTLQRDQPQLHRTLDEAGIPTAGRAVTFHVAHPAQAFNKETSAHSNGSAGQHDSADRASGTDGFGGGGKGSSGARKPASLSNRSRFGDLTTESAANSVTTSHSCHVGLDITA
jgi:flagellar hook-length control protein FliK